MVGQMEAGLQIHNRKYLGAKYRLLDFLSGVIVEKAGRIDTFFDGFAGTGAVALHFTRHARRVVANDILLSNAVINRAFLMSRPGSVSLTKVRGLIEEINDLPPRPGYVRENYGGTYFTEENAARIDAARGWIDEQRGRGAVSAQEQCVLLASLLFAADKAANTVGQYDAFLKNLHGGPYDEAGRHVLDTNVQKPLRLLTPDITLMEGHEVYQQDINELIGEIRADVLYLDPPYNSRQYVDCYHVLENIARWDKPRLYGKTRKFPRERFKSRYSNRGQCEAALRSLLYRCRSRHLFLSYNNEGILQDRAIRDLLGQLGRVEVFEKPYTVFGQGAGRSVKRPIVERLYYCRTNRRP